MERRWGLPRMILNRLVRTRMSSQDIRLKYAADALAQTVWPMSPLTFLFLPKDKDGTPDCPIGIGLSSTRIGPVAQVVRAHA